MQVSPCEMGVSATCTVSGHLLNLVCGDDQLARMGFNCQTEAYNVILDTVGYPPVLHLQHQMGRQVSHISCVISASPMQMC